MIKLAECGTRSAANRHRRWGEELCEDCKQAERDHVKKWAEKNPDRWKEINKDARDKYRSRPEVRESRRAYGRERLKRPEVYETSLRAVHRRRANAMGNGHEPYTTDDVLNEYGFICHICYEEIDLDAPRRSGVDGWERGLHLDHVIPIAAGGADTLKNVLPAHALCNMTKGKK